MKYQQSILNRMRFLNKQVFNHSRVSILLALLFHTTNNAAGGVLPSLFPSLFPHPVIPAAFEFGVIIVAVIAIVTTRGRLGYDQYQRETVATTVGITAS